MTEDKCCCSEHHVGVVKFSEAAQYIDRAIYDVPIGHGTIEVRVKRKDELEGEFRNLRFEARSYCPGCPVYSLEVKQ
jgi:hypothetical protein